MLYDCIDCFLPAVAKEIRKSYPQLLGSGRDIKMPRELQRAITLELNAIQEHIAVAIEDILEERGYMADTSWEDIKNKVTENGYEFIAYAGADTKLDTKRIVLRDIKTHEIVAERSYSDVDILKASEPIEQEEQPKDITWHWN